VTGPSFTSETCMCAPNSPVATSAWHARAAASSPSNNARATAGSAAVLKPGRVPLWVSAASVNWGTSNKPPPMSLSE